MSNISASALHELAREYWLANGTPPAQHMLECMQTTAKNGETSIRLILTKEEVMWLRVRGFDVTDPQVRVTSSEPPPRAMYHTVNW